MQNLSTTPVNSFIVIRIHVIGRNLFRTTLGLLFDRRVVRNRFESSLRLEQFPSLLLEFHIRERDRGQPRENGATYHLRMLRCTRRRIMNSDVAFI